MNYPLRPATRCISIPAGGRDSSQNGSFVAFTIEGHFSTPSSSLNNSHVADITEPVTSTLSTTQRLSIYRPTATLGTCSLSTSVSGGTSQAVQTHHVVSSSASGIASTPTPLSCLEILPTPIPNPEAWAIITTPLQTWSIDRNQLQREWLL